MNLADRCPMPTPVPNHPAINLPCRILPNTHPTAGKYVGMSGVVTQVYRAGDAVMFEVGIGTAIVPGLFQRELSKPNGEPFDWSYERRTPKI